MDRDATQRLEGWLSARLGEPVRVESAEKLGGGVARETWSIAVAAAGGERSRRHLRVVRGENSPGRAIGRAPTEEFALLCETHAAGVLVPRPILVCADTGVLGTAFFVTEFVRVPVGEEWPARRPGGEAWNSGPLRSPGGERAGTFHERAERSEHPAARHPAQPIASELAKRAEPSVPRSQPVTEWEYHPAQSAPESWVRRSELAVQLGRELAKLHRVTPPRDRLRFLDSAPRNLPASRIDRLRDRLDAIGDPQPVLEWTIRLLERNAPDGAGTVLCHGAPGAGSCLVDGGKLLAILDWEGSRWGDPYEDLGEFRAECRRFPPRHRDGDDAATMADFLDGYREISRLDIDGDLLRYWEVMATVDRAVSALEQGHRFVAGGDRSIELALTCRRVAEMEIDLLVETDGFAMDRAHA